jgi:hypothetical protein
MLRAIADSAEAIAPRGERAAEQAAMAMESLYTSVSGDPTGPAASPAAKAAFNELFEQFESPSSYDPRRFLAQIRKIDGLLK